MLFIRSIGFFFFFFFWTEFRILERFGIESSFEKNEGEPTPNVG